MPDRDTRTERLRAGRSVAVGSVTLWPIERVVTEVVTGRRHAWLMLRKEPYAVVVRDAQGIRAVDTHAVALSIDHLSQEVPGLDAMLASNGAPTARR